MEEMTAPKQSKWHVDKSVPLALMCGFALNIGAVVWFAAGASYRLDNVEKQQLASAWQAERIIRLEEQVKNVQTGIGDIKVILQAQNVQQNRER